MQSRMVNPSGRSGTGKHERRMTCPPTARKDTPSIYAALADFILYMKEEKDASPLTLDAYERDLLRFATSLAAQRHGEAGEPAIDSVTAEETRAHMRELMARGLSKASVRRAMYAIGSFFGWAVRWDLIAKSPAARVRVPRREPVREVRSLSKRERAVLVSAAEHVATRSTRPFDTQAPVLVLLMLKTGLRRQEALDLAWRDVDLDAGEVLVRYGKGKKSRRVPIEDPGLIARLAQLRDAGGVGAVDGAELRPVFVGSHGQRLTRTSLYRIFRRVLDAAEFGGKGITPHALRHTFGTVLCARGVPVPYVKDLLGHEDIGSTMIYVHTTPAALRDAVKKLRE